MPFALIPDGFKLQKITKAQESAVNAKRRHDDVIALLNNPETVSSAVTLILAYLTAQAAKSAVQDLKDLGATISDEVEDQFTKKRDVGAPVGVSFEQILDEGLKRLGKLI